MKAPSDAHEVEDVTLNYTRELDADYWNQQLGAGMLGTELRTGQKQVADHFLVNLKEGDAHGIS